MPMKSAGMIGMLALCLAALPAAAQQEPGGPGGQRRGQNMPDGGPKVGEEAPDFTLATLADPEKEVQLSSFEGKKPVCLIFGSYT